MAGARAAAAGVDGRVTDGECSGYRPLLGRWVLTALSAGRSGVIRFRVVSDKL